MSQFFQIRLILSTFFITLFCIPLFAQGTLETAIETIKEDTIKGILKDGQRFSGRFIDRDDLFPFEENLTKAFELKGERFEGELPVHDAFFKKSVDVQIRESVITYKEGQPDGKYIAYDWDGAIVFDAFLKEGTLNGEYISYHKYQKKGLKPFAKVNFVDGKKEGKIVYTDEDGNQIGAGIYKNDLPFDGQFFNSKMDFQSYKNGKLHGKRVERIQYIDINFWVEEGKEKSVYPFKTFDREASVFSVFVEGVFENGEMLEGTFFNHQTRALQVYKAGNLIRKTLISESGRECFSMNFDENGAALNVQLYTNKDKIDFQSDSLLLTGLYKNGLPFQGDFFQKDSVLSNLILHGHYVQGFVVSKTYIHQKGYWMPDENKHLRLSFEKGKVVEGMDIEVYDDLVVQKEYADGLLKTTTFNRTYNFPAQEKIETLKKATNGYAIYDEKNQLISKVTYRSADKSSGTITYFYKEEEKGSVDFENNELTNGAFTWPAIFGKENSIEINIVSGIKKYKETLFDLYYLGEEAINRKLPIIYYAVLPPHYHSTKSDLHTHWADNDEKICLLKKGDGMIVFQGFSDAYILEVFKDGEKVEEQTVPTKEAVEQLVKKFKEEYSLE